MTNMLLQFILIFVCILVTQTKKGAFGSITTGPLNGVVYEGSTNTRITCETDTSFADWVLYPFAGSLSYVELTANGELNSPFNGLFAIDHPPGTQVYTLVIFNATISPPEGWDASTAGLYRCYSNTGGEGPRAYQSSLVVIRSDPVCSSNFTQSTAMLQSGDVVQLSCTIIYGAFRPIPSDAVMTWYVNGQPMPAENVTFTKNSSPTEVTASSTLLINDNFDATYECRTMFSPPYNPAPISDAVLASNTPDYFKTCSISPTTTPTTSTTTITTTSTTPSTTTGLPPCENVLNALGDLLSAKCYEDWIICSSDTNILFGFLSPNCLNHCRSLNKTGGTCVSSTSVGCPCIQPGNKKCQCS